MHVTRTQPLFVCTPPTVRVSVLLQRVSLCMRTCAGERTRRRARARLYVREGEREVGWLTGG